VPDPDANPALKSLIEKAKRDQVPSHVIEKAIDKAKGAGGEDFSMSRYEGFGPGGCFTDVKNCFTKTGSKLGPQNSVAHLFDQLAVLSFKGENEDEVLEAMLGADVDVDDVECKNGQLTVFAAKTDFFKAKTALLEAFPDIELEVQEITFLPQADKNLTEEDVPMFEKFINMLNECEDVQDIYHNAILPKPEAS